MEEGYVDGKCTLLGYVIVDHSDNPKWDENSPYPKVGYQVFYRIDIEQVNTFEAEHESLQRIFINAKDFADHYHDYHELYQEILDYAVYLID